MSAEAAHHAAMARSCRASAAAMASCLKWSLNVDQRRWATDLEDAYTRQAAAEDRYAAALRARETAGAS